MTAFFERISGFLQFSFVQYALIVGVLIALCSSILGVTLVLKRFSFIGDGLSHVAFGAMAVAAVAPWRLSGAIRMRRRQRTMPTCIFRRPSPTIRIFPRRRGG